MANMYKVLTAFFYESAGHVVYPGKVVSLDKDQAAQALRDGWVEVAEDEKPVIFNADLELAE